MINEFSRTELLLGSEAMKKLRSSAVAVFGIGGVGSHAAEALARSGVGCLILIDSDSVSLTNINRQSIALHSTVGQQKTRVMKEKIEDICPHTTVITMEDFVLPENLESLFQRIEKELPPGRSLDYILAVHTGQCFLCSPCGRADPGRTCDPGSGRNPYSIGAR